RVHELHGHVDDVGQHRERAPAGVFENRGAGRTRDRDHGGQREGSCDCPPPLHDPSSSWTTRGPCASYIIERARATLRAPCAASTVGTPPTCSASSSSSTSSTSSTARSSRSSRSASRPTSASR